MTTMLAQDIVKNGAAQFAKYLAAFKECSEGVQAIVIEMSEIVASKDATAEEKEHATEVLVDALFPGLSADTLAKHAASVSPAALPTEPRVQG